MVLGNRALRYYNQLLSSSSISIVIWSSAIIGVLSKVPIFSLLAGPPLFQALCDRSLDRFGLGFCSVFCLVIVEHG